MLLRTFAIAAHRYRQELPAAMPVANVDRFLQQAEKVYVLLVADGPRLSRFLAARSAGDFDGVEQVLMDATLATQDAICIGEMLAADDWDRFEFFRDFIVAAPPM